MNLIPTSLIRCNAHCKDCGYGFTVYTFSDFEYGRRLGRTPNPRELGLVVAFKDPVFEEVEKLVDEFLIPLGIEDRRRAECFNSVFGITCDPSPSGYAYDFTGTMWCPNCSSSNVSYGRDISFQVEVIELAPMTYNAWQQLSEAEKREWIRKALQKAGCLP
jgi:hypothetical protein